MPVKSTRYYHDVAQVFRTAAQFTLAAEQISKADPPLIFPWATTVSLAVELNFKVLARMDGRGFLGTHDLKVLFDDLSEQTKNEIRLRWEAMIGEPRKKELFERYRQNGTPLDERLDIALLLAANSFKKMRYSFEGDLPAHYIGGLERVLYELILQRDPLLHSQIPHWVLTANGFVTSKKS